MIVDPVAMLLKSTVTVPTSTVGPTDLPTVLPNPPIFENATDTGKRTLWVVFVLMVLASAAFAALSWTIPIGRRLYHVVTTLIVITAAISYFAMATGSGVNYHHVHVREQHQHVPDVHHEVYRQVYWARYVDWTLTTPLLLLDLALLAGLTGGHIVLLVAADIVMILTGLFAAYGSEHNGSKWGWYTIACIAYLVVIWHLVIHGRAGAQAKGGKVGSFFVAIGGYTLLLWTAYPIIWGFADGSRKLSVDQEILAYAVLDVLAKPVFGAWLLLTHARLPETNIDIGGFWSNGLSSEGRIRIGEDDEGA